MTSVSAVPGYYHVPHYPNLNCSFSVCILSSNNGAWRTLSLQRAFGCSIHLWRSINPILCCYSVVAPLRSTVQPSQASSSTEQNVGADGGQLHLLATFRLRGFFAWRLAFSCSKWQQILFFAPLGAVCATLDNILETVQLLGVWLKVGHVCRQHIWKTLGNCSYNCGSRNYEAVASFKMKI